jgi:hypothetical protein
MNTPHHRHQHRRSFANQLHCDDQSRRLRQRPSIQLKQTERPQVLSMFQTQQILGCLHRLGLRLSIPYHHWSARYPKCRVKIAPCRHLQPQAFLSGRSLGLWLKQSKVKCRYL